MLEEHRGYLGDTVRTQAFHAALARTLKGGEVVADLGCGSGILGQLALKLGAAHVYAIDEGPILDIARESAARAGLSERTTFIRGRVQQVVLPEQVDVLICDHVGYLGIDYGVLDLLQDAIRRFLKPGGAVIPSRLELSLAPVSSKACETLLRSWRADGVPAEFHWLNDWTVNTKHGVTLRPDDLLGPPVPLADLPIRSVRADFHSWKRTLEIERDGSMHGIAGWFDCELVPGIHMSNSPLAATPINRPVAFLPLGEAVNVRAGQRIDASVVCRPADALLAWTIRFPDQDVEFRQSTWLGMPLDLSNIYRADPQRVPRLTPTAQLRDMILGYCDGRRTAAEIEALVLAKHADAFPTEAEAIRMVTRVLGSDTQP